eukprot:gnl/TRDRNA2_/TRDRNA2_161342_c2_seq1.p1 gnl/TRDRNA2_/TRDRNA2_161342_c2~~gnl/TRDRNA2_/TRDRNA2_161342_c2_seq1.p1  ORF type:complete len:805 (+),score=98.31 gnl/TRDRNA2_/TRDRNA2_161342_c2_seq1:163-2577(+)
MHVERAASDISTTATPPSGGRRWFSWGGRGSTEHSALPAKTSSAVVELHDPMLPWVTPLESEQDEWLSLCPNGGSLLAVCPCSLESYADEPGRPGHLFVSDAGICFEDADEYINLSPSQYLFLWAWDEVTTVHEFGQAERADDGSPVSTSRPSSAAAADANEEDKSWRYTSVTADEVGGHPRRRLRLRHGFLFETALSRSDGSERLLRLRFEHRSDGLGLQKVFALFAKARKDGIPLFSICSFLDAAAPKVNCRLPHERQSSTCDRRPSTSRDEYDLETTRSSHHSNRSLQNEEEDDDDEDGDFWSLFNMRSSTPVWSQQLVGCSLAAVRAALLQDTDVFKCDIHGGVAAVPIIDGHWHTQLGATDYLTTPWLAAGSRRRPARDGGEKSSRRPVVAGGGVAASRRGFVRMTRCRVQVPRETVPFALRAFLPLPDFSRVTSYYRLCDDVRGLVVVAQEVTVHDIPYGSSARVQNVLRCRQLPGGSEGVLLQVWQQIAWNGSWTTMGPMAAHYEAEALSLVCEASRGLLNRLQSAVAPPVEPSVGPPRRQSPWAPDDGLSSRSSSRSRSLSNSSSIVMLVSDTRESCSTATTVAPGQGVKQGRWTYDPTLALWVKLSDDLESEEPDEGDKVRLPMCCGDASPSFHPRRSGSESCHMLAAASVSLDRNGDPERPFGGLQRQVPPLDRTRLLSSLPPAAVPATPQTCGVFPMKCLVTPRCRSYLNIPRLPLPLEQNNSLVSQIYDESLQGFTADFSREIGEFFWNLKWDSAFHTTLESKQLRGRRRSSGQRSSYASTLTSIDSFRSRP